MRYLGEVAPALGYAELKRDGDKLSEFLKQRFPGFEADEVRLTDVLRGVVEEIPGGLEVVFERSDPRDFIRVQRQLQRGERARRAGLPLQLVQKRPCARSTVQASGSWRARVSAQDSTLRRRFQQPGTCVPLAPCGRGTTVRSAQSPARISAEGI